MQPGKRKRAEDDSREPIVGERTAESEGRLHGLFDATRHNEPDRRPPSLGRVRPGPSTRTLAGIADDATAAEA